MKKAEKLNFFCYFLFAHFEYFSPVSVYLTFLAKRGKKETWNEGESVTALFSFLFFLTNLRESTKESDEESDVCL